MFLRKAFLCALGCASFITSSAFGQWSEVVTASQAQFSNFAASLFVGQLQESLTGGYNNGPYYYIQDWGDAGNPSGVVTYPLSGVPLGLHEYRLEFWSPTDPQFGTPGSVGQFHVWTINPDGTNAFPYDSNIPWAGQFGTNRQWLGTEDTAAAGFTAHPYNPGGWTQAGPGPQSDQTLGTGTDAGSLVWMNNLGNGQMPSIYIQFQPFYTNPIAFDAIRVTEVPEPSALMLGLLGTAGLGAVVWKWRRRTGA